MNLWILHYSFINHRFHHSTITIKQKIIINKLVTVVAIGAPHRLHTYDNRACSIISKFSVITFSNDPVNPSAFVSKVVWINEDLTWLVTELFWGHFLWKNSCSNEKRQIPRDPAGKRRIPRLNSAAQFRGNPNSAARFEIPRPAENCGPYTYMPATLVISAFLPPPPLSSLALRCHHHLLFLRTCRYKVGCQCSLNFQCECRMNWSVNFLPNRPTNGLSTQRMCLSLYPASTSSSVTFSSPSLRILYLQSIGSFFGQSEETTISAFILSWIRNYRNHTILYSALEFLFGWIYYTPKISVYDWETGRIENKRMKFKSTRTKWGRWQMRWRTETYKPSIRWGRHGGLEREGGEKQREREKTQEEGHYWQRRDQHRPKREICVKCQRNGHDALDIRIEEAVVISISIPRNSDWTARPVPGGNRWLFVFVFSFNFFHPYN